VGKQVADSIPEIFIYPVFHFAYRLRLCLLLFWLPESHHTVTNASIGRYEFVVTSEQGRVDEGQNP